MRNGFIGLAGALVLASTMATAGCSSSGGTNGSGGSSGGGTGGSATGGASGVDAGGTSVTSISGSKPLNTLTTAEANQLCGDAGSYYARSISKSNSCKFTALSFALSSSAPTEADLQAGCSSTESACDQSDAGTGTTTCDAIPSTCAATVAQYSACIKDEAALFTQTVSALPGCSTLTRAGFDAIYAALGNLPGGATPPASCAALATACPDLNPPPPK